MHDITIQKLDERGRVVVSYGGVVRERLAQGIVVEARWERPPLDLGYARFEPGDRFVEWFFTDRWYNIFAIHAGSTDALKGWYCNVAAPATIEDTLIRCRDLMLDLWVDRDGSLRVLDTDEFAAATTISAAERAEATRALDALCALVQRRAPPFDGVVASAPGGYIKSG